MNVRLVCVFASSSCIAAEPAAYVEENVESENTDFRAVAALLSALDATTAVTFWFGVSENDGTRAYIFVNIWKSLGQIAPL